MSSSFTQPPPIPASLPAARLLELEEARVANRKIRRAISVALFDGWTLAIFAALTFVCGVTSGWVGPVLGVGMGIMAYVELRGIGRLRRLDPTAGRALGYNQIALGFLLFVYAVWMLHAELTGGGTMAELQSAGPEVAQMMKQFGGLDRQIAIAVYGTLMAVAVFAQGGTAWFYFTREKYIRAYIERTPQWILDMQKAGFTP